MKYSNILLAVLTILLITGPWGTLKAETINLKLVEQSARRMATLKTTMKIVEHVDSKLIEIADKKKKEDVKYVVILSDNLLEFLRDEKELIHKPAEYDERFKKFKKKINEFDSSILKDPIPDPPISEDPITENPILEDPTQGGQIIGGTIEKGSTQEYSTIENTTGGGPTMGYPTQKGPTQKDPTQKDPTQKDPTQKDPTQKDTTQKDTTQKDPTPEDLTGPLLPDYLNTAPDDTAPDAPTGFYVK